MYSVLKLSKVILLVLINQFIDFDKNIKSSCFDKFFKPVSVTKNSVGLQTASAVHLGQNSSRPFWIQLDAGRDT